MGPGEQCQVRASQFSLRSHAGQRSHSWPKGAPPPLALDSQLLPSPKAPQPGLQLQPQSLSKAPFTEPCPNNGAFISLQIPTLKVGSTPQAFGCHRLRP